MADSDAHAATALPRTSNQRLNRQQQVRGPRLRLACQRCQRRKIRCDGHLPRCNNCRSTGSECIDGQSARLKEFPRAYVTALTDRVKWLENIVRAQCPDIDLAQGPQCEDLQMLSGGGVPSGPAADAVPPADAAQTESRTASHEIGLVSLGTSQDPRYIGPSSGYFLARLMLTKRGGQAMGADSDELPFAASLIQTVQSPASLPSRDAAGEICGAYFDSLHVVYPILHRPTFDKMFDQMYTADSAEPEAAFQVFMVMALGSLAAAQRLKARLPSESYCLSALQSFERVNIESTLQGLQCLLLLLIFTLHNPHVRVNIWYLNYHALAAVVDLGLQRDITKQTGISLLEQEMRTRIFWVVFMVDRIVATTMGRPIGLRDEACDLRLPRELDDAELGGTVCENATFKPISYSIHLFRLAKLNSEIKYVAHSVVRKTPVYAYPAIVDMHHWQSNVLEQIDQWEDAIPAGDDTPASQNLRTICRIQGHVLRMVLTRPSPAIPQPTRAALEKCRISARATLNLLNELYIRDALFHSWLTFHAVVLSTLSLLFCITTVPELRRQTRASELMGDRAVASSILSATGEHWSGAKKCRLILDELGRSVINELMDAKDQSSRESPRRQRAHREPPPPSQSNSSTSLLEADPLSHGTLHTPAIEPSIFFDEFLGGAAWGIFGAGHDSSNIDEIMRGMFHECTTPFV